MFNSIYIGLSGLNAYSRGLQQVSNNVSNLNSLGFKSSTVTFSNLQGSLGSGSLSFTRDSNGSGQGVQIGDGTTDFRTGELRQSQRDLDISVDGNGFLVLMKGDEVRYARTGSFEVDRDGYIVLSGTDFRLATLDSSGRATALSIDSSRTNSPQMTTKISFADNLSSSATSYGISDVRVYDANGKENVWQLAFTRSGTTSDWTLKVTDQDARTIGEQLLKFIGGAPDPATSKLVFANVDSGLSVEFDFSANVSSFSSGTVSTLRASSVDGNPVGAITTVAVNDKGELEISYSNDKKKVLGAVALADFRDPQALEQETGGLFRETTDAGRGLLASSDARVGRAVSRRLEASNVDLSRQFGDLILIQRGFQASSQIISASNEMIQQLFGIRGQG
ncbi:MAG: flagellar hook-basal body complex protein [Pseudomonadota bacterium]